MMTADSNSVSPGLCKVVHTVRERGEMLERTQWSSDFNWRQLETLAEFLLVYQAKKGTRIFLEGDTESYMCLIAKGRVSIVKEDSEHGHKVLSTLDRGQTFGEMALIDQEPRSASAIAAQDSMLLILSKENLDLLLDRYHRLGVQVLMKLCRMMSQRLRQTSGLLVDFLEAGVAKKTHRKARNR